MKRLLPQLLFCPPPENGEGLAGYRLRLAEANGYPSPYWLTLASGEGQRLGQGKEDLEVIAALTGHSVAGLSAQFFGKKPIPPRFLNVLHPRICPECLRDKPILRKLWDVSLVVCCPMHGRILVDTCPSCGHQLSWNRPSVVQCSCGFDLREAGSPNAGPLTAALTGAIAAEIEGLEAPLTSRASCPHMDFDIPRLKLTAEELLMLVLFLGAYSAKDLRPRTLKRTALSSVASAIRVVENSAHTLVDWPRGFCEMFDRVSMSRIPAQALGARQAYGRMYCYLYGTLKSDRFSFLREAFEAYLRDKWEGLFDGRYRSLSDKTRELGKYISTTAAAQQLGMAPARVHTLVRSGKIRGRTRTLPSGRTLVLVGRDELSRFAHRRSQLLTAKEARQRLGITKRRFSELMKHGVIKAISGPKVDESKQWQIPRKNIDGLLKAFRIDHSEKSCAQETGGLITLQRILQCRFSHEGDFPAFIRAIKRREISPQERVTTSPGLGGTLFRPTDINRFLARRRTCPSGSVKLVDAARYLGIKEEVVYHLVRVGLLKCHDAHIHARPARLVSRKDLEQFQRDFVAGSEVSRELGASPKSIASRLQLLGVKALVGPSIDGSRQFIFPRQRVLCALERD